MKTKMRYTIRLCFALLLTAWLATGCSDADQDLLVPRAPYQTTDGTAGQQEPEQATEPEAPADSSAMQREIYVRLLISAGNAAGTRADGEPTAGEIGDGTELGTASENAINNLTVFMYRDTSTPMLGINAPDNTNFMHTAYFSSTTDDLTTAETGFSDGTYTVTEDIHGGLTSGTVVEYQAKFYHGPGFRADELEKFKIIVVANAGDLSKIGPLGNLRNYLVAASVNSSDIVMSNERDIILSSGKAYTGVGTKEAPFLYHVDLERLAARIDFDKLNAATDMTNGLKYAVGTVADLYVEQIRIVNGAIEPSYLIKRVAPTIGGTVTYLGDETTSGTPAIPNNYVIEPHTADKVAVNKADDTFLTARYGDSRLSESLNPAIFFSGTTYEVDKTTNQTWTLGYVDENTFAAAETCKEFSTGLLLKATYVPKAIYTAGDLSTSTTGTKGTTFWHFQPKTGDINKTLDFATETAANNYILEGHPGAITEYPNGTCYYYIWIRHANNNNEGSYCPMEYAIVRNNIYRIYVESLTGPGSVTPNPQEPEGLKAKIYVRKWREVVHPEIIL